jgi:glycosyltransferase involved in cell wall biosynthesis
MHVITPRLHPAPPQTGWPAVSVVMPVYREERFLRTAVRRVLQQDYPGELELVLAVVPSDRSAAIAQELRREDPRVRVVMNPSGSTPAGLNAALVATVNPVVVRVDGHSDISDGYLRRVVEVLTSSGADNVGGVMEARGTTPFEIAVACAMSSRIGVGAAPFRVGGSEGPADSVYLGAFRRETLARLGGFDDGLRRAQDWELNYRIRQAGGTVWFCPDLRVGYHPRSTMAGLLRQFHDSGRWRRAVVRRHPSTVTPRYLAPALLLLTLVVSVTFGAAGQVARPSVWLFDVLVLTPMVYLLAVGLATVRAGRGLPWRARLLLPVVVVAMHLAWGAGFARGGNR